MIDTHRGWRWRASVAAAFGHAFVAQRAAVAAFASVGVQASWLPLAVPSELCLPGPALADRYYDVAMVGHVEPGSVRAQILSTLHGHFRIAPSSGFLAPSQMMELYRSSRVVVNVPLANDLNMRAFEALGARSLLVSGAMDGADDLIGQLPITVPVASDPAVWIAQVRQALEESDQDRADQGYRLVTTAHTYDQRAATVLEVLSRDQDDRSTAAVLRSLADGWARWGDAGEVWRLTRSPTLTAKAIGWRGLSAAKRTVASARMTRWVHRWS